MKKIVALTILTLGLAFASVGTVRADIVAVDMDIVAQCADASDPATCYSENRISREMWEFLTNLTIYFVLSYGSGLLVGAAFRLVKKSKFALAWLITSFTTCLITLSFLMSGLALELSQRMIPFVSDWGADRVLSAVLVMVMTTVITILAQTVILCYFHQLLNRKNRKAEPVSFGRSVAWSAVTFAMTAAVIFIVATIFSL